jgi:hemolysin III
MSIHTEPFNVFSHLFGAVVNGVVALVLAAQALTAGQIEVAFGLIVFGFCMSTSYLASVAYHATAKTERRSWLRWDRAGIYLAIAGFHTVNGLSGIPGAARSPFLMVVWGLALYFICRELRCNSVKEPTGVLGFCLSGAVGLVGWNLLAAASPETGIVWFVFMALMFSVGVVLLRCHFIPANHEMWHIMVIGGNMFMFVGWSEVLTLI